MVDVNEQYQDFYDERAESIPQGFDDVPTPSFSAKDLMKVGATFIAYPILINAMEKGWGKIGPSISRGVSTLIAAGTRGQFSRAYAQAYARMARGPTLRQTVSELPRSHVLRTIGSAYRTRTSSVARDYDAWRISSKIASASAGNAASPIAARGAIAKDFFARMREPQWRKGAALRYAEGYLGRSVAFYAADRVIGKLEGRRDGPNVLNVPGTILDYAKFTAGFMPIDALLMGGGKLAKHGINKGLTGAREKAISHNEQITQFLGSASKHTEAANRIVSTGLYAFHAGMKEIRKNVSWRDATNVKFAAQFGQPTNIVAAMEMFGEGWRRGILYKRQLNRIARNKSPMGMSFEKVLKDWEGAARFLGGSEDTGLHGLWQDTAHGAEDAAQGKFFAKQFTRRLKKEAQWKPSLMEDALGLRRAKLHEVDEEKARMYAGKVGRILHGARGEELSERYFRRFTKDIFVDSNVYTLGDGSLLNLRPLDPRAALKRAYQKTRMLPVLRQAFGIIEVVPRLLFDKGVESHYSDYKEAYHAGKLPDDIRAASSTDQRNLAFHDMFSPDKEDQAAFFFGGHHYLLERGKVRILSPGRKYRMLDTSYNSYLQRIMGSFYGYPGSRVALPVSVHDKSGQGQAGMSEMYGWERTLGPKLARLRERLHEKILRPIEIGTGLGEGPSILQSIKDMTYGKYLSPHSTPNLFGTTSSILNPEFLEKFARTTSRGEKDRLRVAMATAVNITNRTLGKITVNAADTVYRKFHVFRDLLDVNLNFASSGEAGSMINVAKAVEDNVYLWDQLQRFNPNAPRLAKNKPLANTIANVQGRNIEDFMDYMAVPTAKGYGGLTISRLDELKHYLISEAIEGSEAITSGALQDAARRAGSSTLKGVSRHETGLLEVFAIKKTLRDSLSASEGITDEDLISRVGDIISVRDDIFKLVQPYTTGIRGFFSGGDMPNFTTKISGGDLLDKIKGSPYVSIPDSLVAPGSHGWSKFVSTFFPKAFNFYQTGEQESELHRLGMIPMWLGDRFMRIGGMVGFAPDPAHLRSSRAMLATTMKWGAAISTMALGYNALDTFTDINPAFKGTMFDEGITVAMAEQVAKARLTGAFVQDKLGITSAMQYTEGLMPGSVSSTGARMARFAGPMLAAPAIGFAAGGSKGAALGSLAGLLMGSFGAVTDERDREQLIEEYSGRKSVAVRKGRWWELSRGSYQGQNIDYFRPNWFARLKAQHMITPDSMGSKAENFLFANPPLGFNPLGTLIDPYHYERKHYLSRPYPSTGGYGEEIPLFGPLVGFATSHAPRIGPLHLPMTKPGIMMHREEMVRASTTFGANQGNIAPSYFGNEDPIASYQKQNFLNTPGSTVARGIAPQAQTSVASTLGALEYKALIEPMGLVGFGHEALMGKLQGKSDKSGLFEPTSMYESANQMYQFQRRYWDLNLGGLMGLTEFWRRLVPRKQYEAQYVNPISNRMPHWVNASDRGIDFTVGDPYAKIPEGEFRLPGRGYESAHNVKKSFPEGASILGYSVPEMVERLLGMEPPMDEDAFDVTSGGTYLHRLIQQQLAKDNLLVSAEKMVYDPRSDLSGYIDAIIRKGNTTQVVEIKTIAGDKLGSLMSPRSKHYSQINFYMRQQGQKEATILYVSRDDPRQVKAFDVHYSENRFQEDIRNLQKARTEAAIMAEEGYGSGGAGYSYVDRLAILSDIAPYSEQYKDVLKKVRIQSAAGMLTEDDMAIIKTSLEQRREKARRVDVYPYRFMNPEMFNFSSLFRPDATYPAGINPNEFIKPAAEYSFPERLAGYGWEGFCVPGTELIETAEGYVNADRVVEGDMVRTHTGSWKTVEKVWVRKAVEDDLMVIIHAGGHQIPLRTTKGHKLMTSTGPVAAKDVKRGDELLFPAVNFPLGPDELDVLTVEPALRLIEVDGQEFVRKQKSAKPFPRYLKKTQQLMRFFGYYISRGGLVRSEGTNHGVRMSFASDDCQNDAIRTMLENLVSYSIQSVGGYDYVKFKNAPLGFLMDHLFGDGPYKKIPPFVLESSDEMLLAFLKGIFLNRSFRTFIYEKPNLLLQLSKILLHFKVPHSVVKDDNRFYNLIVDEATLAKVIQTDVPQEDREWWMTFEESGVAHLVVRNARVDYHVPANLYDFTVYEDHTYCTGLFCIHNSHLDTPIHSRFMHYQSPVEEYERTKVYGRGAAFWEHPYRDFVEPWTTSALASDTRAQGMVHGAVLGSLFGPPGAIMGMHIGGHYGAIRGTAYALGAERWVPNKIQNQREMERYFDRLEYMKAKQLFDLTGDEEYQKTMNETMMGVNPYALNSQGWINIFRAVPAAEKPFFMSFSETTDRTERKQILQLVPEEVGSLLKIKWAQHQGGPAGETVTDMQQIDPDMTVYQDLPKFLNENKVPGLDWQGWAPGARIEDVKLMSARHEGWDCLHPDQEIVTSEGLTKIGSISKEALILNSQGEFVHPISIFSRPHDGTLLEISFKGTPHKMMVTETHMMNVAKKCSRFEFKEIPAGAIRRYNRLQLASLPLKGATTEIDGVKLDYDLATILGWFLAEGSFLKRDGKLRGVEFSLAITERHVADELAGCIRRVFGKNTNIYERTGAKNCIAVHSFGGTIAQFIHKMTGEYSDGKHLDPSLLDAPLEFLRQVVRCWFVGDGWETPKELCAHTNSKALSYQIWHILRSVGIHASLQFIEERTSSDGYTGAPGYRVRLGRAIDIDAMDTPWVRQAYSSLTVKSVDEMRYTGTVYDIEMPDDHFYTTLCGTVHNSHDFGLGWKDQMQRIENTPYAIQPIQMTKLTSRAASVLEETPTDRNALQSAINKILSSNGAKGRVMIDEIPGSMMMDGPSGGQPVQVEIRVHRKKVKATEALGLIGFGYEGMTRA